MENNILVMSNELKDMIVNLYLDEYSGWNFYHFNDTLEDYHHIKVSDTFIYNLFFFYVLLLHSIISL